MYNGFSIPSWLLLAWTRHPASAACLFRIFLSAPIMLSITGILLHDIVSAMLKHPW